VRVGRSQSVVKKSPRRPLKRSSVVEGYIDPTNSLSSHPLSLKVLFLFMCICKHENCGASGLEPPVFLSLHMSVILNQAEG